MSQLPVSAAQLERSQVPAKAPRLSRKSAASLHVSVCVEALPCKRQCPSAVSACEVDVTRQVWVERVDTT